MQIVLIVAVMATLLIADSAVAAPLPGSTGARLLLVMVAMASVPVLATFISTLTVRRLRLGSAEPRRLSASYRRLRKLHVVVWLAVVVAVAQMIEWPRIVRFNWHLDRVPLVDDLLILLPVLLPLVLSWAAFYRVDRVGFACRSGQAGEPGVSLAEYLGLHVRHYLGLVLLPVLVLLALQDLIVLSGANVQEGVGAVLLAIGSMILLLALFPVLLRCVWRTQPLAAGPLRDRLEAAAQRGGLQIAEILVWQTGSMIVNAAVTGFARRFRYVLLTDGLLELLDEDQIVAVFGHELAHVRHRHLWLRVAAMLIPLSFGLLAVEWFAGPLATLADQIQTAGGDANIALAVAGFAAMVLYVLTFFGLYSRSLEHEADLSACRSLPPEVGVSSFCSALEQLANAYGNRNRRSWQHSSIARRVEFLRSVEREPNLGLRFCRRIRLLGRIVIVLSLSPLIGLLLICFLPG